MKATGIVRRIDGRVIIGQVRTRREQAAPLVLSDPGPSCERSGPAAGCRCEGKEGGGRTGILFPQEKR